MIRARFRVAAAVAWMLAAAWTAIPAAGQTDASPAPPPGQAVAGETELDRQAREIASELRCPVCQGLSIQDSPSEMAQDMRALMRDQLAQGKSAEDVKAFFVQGYGEWILMEPRAEGFNLTVYLLPVAALLAGAAFVVWLTRRWTRASTARSRSAVPEEDPDLVPWDEATAP